MLIVLDNARDETQVRPLLAPDRSCLVVVTSRNPLTGLAAADGALAAARATGDLAAQAESLKNLGYTDLRRGDYVRAADRLRSALTLYQEVGDSAGKPAR